MFWIAFLKDTSSWNTNNDFFYLLEVAIKSARDFLKSRLFDLKELLSQYCLERKLSFHQSLIAYIEKQSNEFNNERLSQV